MPSIPGRLTPAPRWLAAFLFVILGRGTCAEAGLFTWDETYIQQTTEYGTRTFYSSDPFYDYSRTADISFSNLPRTVDAVGSTIGPDLQFNFDTLGHAQAYQDYRGISAVEAYYHDPSFVTHSNFPSNLAGGNANNVYKATTYFKETILNAQSQAQDAIFRFVAFPSLLKIIDELPVRVDRTASDELHAEFVMDIWTGDSNVDEQLYLYFGFVTSFCG